MSVRFLHLDVAMLSADLALDFGSVTTRLANGNGRILYEEPTLVACHQDTGEPLSYGTQARSSGAQSSGRLRLVHPIAGGQLANIEVAQALLQHVIKSVGRKRLLRRRVLVTMPIGTTPVQLRAMTRALEHAGVHRVRYLEQPIASALGAKVAIEAPLGTMVVDIGGEITNMAAIALGGVIVGTTIACGGETLDRAIAHELLMRAQLVVDPQVAREIRREFGTLERVEPNLAVDVVGRDRSNGEPRAVRISQHEISEILERELEPMFQAASRMVSDSPPDIANDLLSSGIVLAGGASLLEGLPHRLALVTGIPVHVFDHPDRLGVLGAARCLASYNELEDAFTAAPQR